MAARKTSSGRKKATTRKKAASGAKKSNGRKTSPTQRKYSRKSVKKVERALHEMKRGQLKSGASGKQVKSRKQAIAIGLSEAWREGDKVPDKKG